MNLASSDILSGVHGGSNVSSSSTFSMPSTCRIALSMSCAMSGPAGQPIEVRLYVTFAVEGPKVKVLYSLTSMGCPAGPLIAQDMESAVRQVEGVDDVELELTFDPPWTPDKMSDDAKFILGFG